ncbi:MAG: tRNA (N6-threonylcarbamoyladenosine(37)-N6)-methyltransferase TrmO [Betaproteobacteria bacterium]|nr:tRNA (N6-threonylcarbamoyladenosine(37)-N6)-methyltransferase TrmO [Betaproteobacteria bacterium]
MFTFSPVGVIHSCFKEKFGIPRQPGLVPEARAILELLPPYSRAEAVRGLENFSHIWISFVFHACLGESWKPTVRPPRLGGNRRLGVFATRSTHRPNPIGLSAVELEKIIVEQGKVLLHLKGIDLLDGTPVLDIKPYLPYSDRIAEATGGFAAAAPAAPFKVQFSQSALDLCATVPQLEALIRRILSLDPRPAYYGKGDGKSIFGMKLLDYDVQWEVDGEVVLVNAVIPIGEMSIP